ncbi:hypothetical protein ABZ799_28835 [Nocardiopsis dassonvillei]|uniref:hypothetical protein n=1 Tax=Nocardiopsis dassonvillei TaxID=2014 RepID=UPI0033C8FDDC
MGKRDDQAEKNAKAAQEKAEKKKGADVNDGRNRVHTNRGVVISANTINGGINF